MWTDPEQCYRAFAAHDPRFDGRVYVGVSSTGIYCRPVCRVRLPKAANCRFFAHAAAAEAAGFRPCLRCRPELAPGLAPVDAPERLALACARALEADPCGERSLAEIATALGVSDRHLRRVFEHCYGVRPIEYAQTQRLLLAKRLLTDTRLPLTEVAYASGFRSLRRFQATLQSRYRLSAGDIRRQGVPADRELRFSLGYRGHYDFAGMLAFLAPRAVAGVERVQDQCYQRCLRIETGGRRHQGWISLRHREGLIELALAPELAAAALPVLARVRRLLDLDADVEAIAAGLGSFARRPGLRVPGAVDGFEVAVRAVLGQLVSVAQAQRFAAWIAAHMGTPLDTPLPGLNRLFPSAAELAAQAPEAFHGSGIARPRVAAILALARAVRDGELRLDPGADPTRTRAALRALPGFGEWTVEYVAMRALSDPDALPASDLGLKKALGLSSPAAIRRAAEAWRPFRSYAVMQAWLGPLAPPEDKDPR